jgi:hypothetical protein
MLHRPDFFVPRAWVIFFDPRGCRLCSISAPISSTVQGHFTIFTIIINQTRIVIFPDSTIKTKGNDSIRRIFQVEHPHSFWSRAHHMLTYDSILRGMILQIYRSTSIDPSSADPSRDDIICIIMHIILDDKVWI